MSLAGAATATDASLHASCLVAHDIHTVLALLWAPRAKAAGAY